MFNAVIQRMPVCSTKSRLQMKPSLLRVHCSTTCYSLIISPAPAPCELGSDMLLLIRGGLHTQVPTDVNSATTSYTCPRNGPVEAQRRDIPVLLNNGKGYGMHSAVQEIGAKLFFLKQSHLLGFTN
jgi:hypothetical protein